MNEMPMWMQGEEDKGVVWEVKHVLIYYYRFNVGGPRLSIGRGQSSSLEEWVLPHELISRLQAQVSPQPEEKPAIDLYKFQHWSGSTAKNHVR